MIRLRQYKATDADTILLWCQDEISFYKWTAGVLGSYPITQNEFRFVESLMPFTAFDETGIVGFFTLRNPNASLDELRFGFVIINHEKRGKGYGKTMLRLGLKGSIKFLMFYMVNDFAKYPVSIYNNLVKTIITYIIPFAFTAYYPASYILTGENPLFCVGLTAVISVIIMIISVLIWNKGISAYESAGS